MKIREVSSAEIDQPLEAEGEREKFDRNQWIKNHIETVANGIIDMLHMHTGDKADTSRWGGGIGCMPHNAATKHIYRGLNAFSLRMEGIKRGFSDMRFVTLNQCNKLGGRIKKGQTGFKILQPKIITKQCKLHGEPGELDTVIIGEDGKKYTERKFMVFNIKTVFNVEQTTLGLPPEAAFSPRDWKDHEFFEKFMQASAIPILHGKNKAFYDPNKDQISLPQKELFFSPSLYYGTMLHEFYHASGHESRENRLGKNDSFGSPEYAQEELRAEIFACLCTSAFGLNMPSNRNVSYIENWLDGKDAKQIIQAATEAEDVFRIIVSVAHGQQPDCSWFPDRSQWPEKMPIPLDDIADADSSPRTVKIKFSDTISLADYSNALTKKEFSSPTLHVSPVLSPADETATFMLKNWLEHHDYSDPSVLTTSYLPKSGQWAVFSPSRVVKRQTITPMVASFEDVTSMLNAFDTVGLPRPTILSEIPDKWERPKKATIPPFEKLHFSDGTTGGVNGHIIDLTQCSQKYTRSDGYHAEIHGETDENIISVGSGFKIEIPNFTQELKLEGLFHHNSAISPCVMAYAGDIGVAMDFASTQYFATTHGDEIHFFCDHSKTPEQIAEGPLLVRRGTGEIVGVVAPLLIHDKLQFILHKKEYKELQQQIASIPLPKHSHEESAEETISPAP